MIANCFLSQQKRKPTEELARLIKTQAASFYSYYNIRKKFPEIYKAQIKKEIQEDYQDPINGDVYRS